MLEFQTAYDSGTLFFQNWAKHVKPGGVGYKSDIDPINDLTNKTIETAIIMHAVKVRSAIIPAVLVTEIAPISCL